MATMRIPTEFTAIDKFSSVVGKMANGVSSFEKKATSSIDKLNAKLNKIGTGLLVGGTALAAPLGVAAKSALDFEDKMSDIAKTTGLSGKPLDDFGKSILTMSKITRTSIDDLLTIGEIGGQLGVAEKDLVSFTEASNKFAVALGSDYGGTDQAISQVGKINSLFKDTRGLNIADSITKTGSAINELGAVGAGTSQNINDFVLRMGALPDALKSSFANTAAMGTFFEEMGIDAQIASGGVTNLLLVAGKQVGGFAKQMGITKQAAKSLLAADPTAFAVRFAKSLNGLKPDVLAKKLEKLGLGSQETIKSIGALGSGSVRLAELMKVSNDAFAKGTSLQGEYEKKNETTAAKLAKAKNNFQALSITIGTQLLPIISDLIAEVLPVVESFSNWITKNKELVRYAVLVAGAMWGIGLGIKGVTVAIGIAKGAMAIWTGLTAAYEAVALTAALGTGSFAAAIWAVAAPILLIIGIIAAVIAIFYYWGDICRWFEKTWKHLTNGIMGEWNGLTSWFEEFSFKDFFMGIGQSIIDFMLFPLKAVLSLLSYIPGAIGDGAQKGLDMVNEMSNLNKQFGVEATQVSRVEAPEVANARMMQENRVSGGVNINIKDKGGNMDSADAFNGGGIPISLSSTQGAF